MKYDEHTDNRYLGLTFDTQSGIDVLKALLGLGRDKVSVRLMLSFALSKTEGTAIRPRGVFHAKKNSLVISELSFRRFSSANKIKRNNKRMMHALQPRCLVAILFDFLSYYLQDPETVAIFASEKTCAT